MGDNIGLRKEQDMKKRATRAELSETAEPPRHGELVIGDGWCLMGEQHAAALCAFHWTRSETQKRWYGKHLVLRGWSFTRFPGKDENR